MTPKNRLRAWTRVSASAALVIFAILFLRGSRTVAQNFPAIIGRIEGDDLEVVTTTPAGVETNAAPTDVASGSEVTVRSGHALLLLNAGGEVSVCGPAHFKLIKSPQNVTLALDYGRVHASLESADTFTIYTPAIVATPIAISGGRRDTTVGLDQGGEMCVLTSRGAMRVEQQFADQNTIIPQGGTVSLAGGQIKSLRADPSACSCDFPRASVERSKPRPAPAPASSAPRREVSAMKRPQPPELVKAAKSAPPAAPKEGPVYTFLLPPLTFNASAPEPPPEPDPETILLVREVRLRPAAVFRGRVKPAPSSTSAAAVTPAPPRIPDDTAPQTQPGFFDRVRNFFRKMTGHGPCPGAGCNS